MTILYGSRGTGLTLADALAVLPTAYATALLSTPTAYAVAALAAGELAGPNGVLSADDVFDARVFDGTAELRWLHDADRRGTAVVIGEQPELVDLLPTRLADVPVISAIDTRYVVWGRPTPAAHPGWATLTAARIGQLSLPLPGSAADHRAVLLAREYVAVCDHHGNAGVIDERLIGLSTVEVRR